MKKFLIFCIILMPLSAFSQDWKTYPYYPERTEIQFPYDEGSHVSLPVAGLEWWYIVIHATGETTGDKYSILVTHFNNQIRFFTVTNITKEKHKSATAMGLLRSKKGHLDLNHATPFGRDYMRTKKDAQGNLIPFEYEIQTLAKDMRINADIIAVKPPMIVGKTGYVPIGKSGHSWYYSLTRLNVNAVLTFEGVTEKINGTAWMDHQWGPFFVSPVEFGGIFETYEWFCIHLDNGSELMISNIYDRSYNLPQDDRYGGIQYMDPDGNSHRSLDRTFTRTAYWQDPKSGHYMSMGWELDVPEWDLNLILEPEFKNQMVRFPLKGDFWEGSIQATGTINGQEVSGQSFGELIHRFKKPKLSVKIKNYPVKMIYGRDDRVRVNWKVLNPDEGNPLHFDVKLVCNERDIDISRGIEETSASFIIGDILPENNNSLNFRVEVTAKSVDETIQASAKSRFLWIDKWWDLFDKDGVVQPDSYHQRYRRPEYDENKPFFQWWYYTIKDLENNRYFAFDYSMSDCVNDMTNEGAYVMFAMVDRETGERFHKYLRFPLDDFKVENDFDVKIGYDGIEDFEIEVIDDDTYHVRGRMERDEMAWFADGCEEDLFIEWDLMIHRNYGWYGQQDIQEITKMMGLISWNTYAHDSEVEGHITVGDKTYFIDRNKNFRAYCDQNWGENFPTGEPSIEYPWGWYYVGKPAASPEDDVSIIAGIGRYDLSNSFPVKMPYVKIPGIGKFADIRLDSDTHIGLRSVEFFPESPEATGLPGIVTTNDGKIKKFEVKRDNWVEYSDSLGKAMIPLNQKVHLETDNYIIILDYFSEIEDYNRLLFPHENYIFSDFEGLGVDVHVTITHKKGNKKYKWWDIFHLFPEVSEGKEVLHDFWSDDGGLEYGYDVNSEIGL